MRRNPPFLVSVGEAFRKGGRAAAQNLPAILSLQAAMAIVVAVYYLWPAGADLLRRYGAWQTAGGVLGNGLAAALAGGVLSEVSLVCFQNHGRWTASNLENLVFKFSIFFVAGGIVFEFYRFQAFWWGRDATLAVVVHKVLFDQFVYTVFWASPYYSVLTRWQALRYSFPKLRNELNVHFLTDRLLPVLVTNWMFWIPAISFVYAMPSILQPPLYVFATAIWGLLVPAVTRQESAATVQAVSASPAMLAGTVE